MHTSRSMLRCAGLEAMAQRHRQSLSALGTGRQAASGFIVPLMTFKVVTWSAPVTTDAKL